MGKSTDKPMCKICEHAHAPGSPHIWNGKVPAAASPKPNGSAKVSAPLEKSAALAASEPQPPARDGGTWKWIWVPDGMVVTFRNPEKLREYAKKSMAKKREREKAVVAEHMGG